MEGFVQFSHLAICALASCGNQPHIQNVQFSGVAIPADKVNTLVKLLNTPAMANSQKNNDDLTLQLINSSDKTIVFPDNFGVKVYEEKAGSWLEIQNKFYNSGGSFSLPPKNLAPAGLPVTILPNIPGLSAPENIRIMVIGYIGDINGEPVGAYVDIVLKP